MKILICGVGGRMGREVAKLALDGMRGAVPVAGFDVLPVDTREFPTYTDWNAVTELPDCIIDFSHHAGTDALLAFAVRHHIPVVLATTGHTEEELTRIHEASKSTAIFFSANMSVGVALLAELAKQAAKTLGMDFDVEIVEKHHNKKLDAPSGTARSLADIVDANMDVKTDIQSVRCGEIPGIHTVGFEGLNDRITLSHEAFSREGFAAGAVEAALRTEGLTGVHEFKDILMSSRA